MGGLEVINQINIYLFSQEYLTCGCLGLAIISSISSKVIMPLMSRDSSSWPMLLLLEFAFLAFDFLLIFLEAANEGLRKGGGG